MPRKPLTTRSAFITTAALTGGSAAGTLAGTIATHLGYSQPGIGRIATGLTALWILDKLNTLVDDDSQV